MATFYITGNDSDPNDRSDVDELAALLKEDFEDNGGTTFATADEAVTSAQVYQRLFTLYRVTVEAVEPSVG